MYSGRSKAGAGGESRMPNEVGKVFQILNAQFPTPNPEP
jgi:hypothetical protein